MKSVFLAVVLAVSTNALAIQAQACSPAEAQFIGEVTAVQKRETKDGIVCEIKVSNFRFFQASGVCGADESDVSKAWLKDASCSIQLGDEASGIFSAAADGGITW